MSFWKPSRRYGYLVAVALGLMAARPAGAEELLVLAHDRPDQFVRADRAVIIAGPDAAVAGKGMSDLSARDAGVDFKILTVGATPPPDRIPIYLATAAERQKLGGDAPAAVAAANLAPEGFSITTRGGDKPG